MHPASAKHVMATGAGGSYNPQLQEIVCGSCPSLTFINDCPPKKALHLAWKWWTQPDCLTDVHAFLISPFHQDFGQQSKG